MRRILWGVAGLSAAIALLVALPGPIDSWAFRPGPTPAPEGALAPNRLLEACERISEGEIVGADKLILDESGRVYAGDVEGRVHRLTPGSDGRWRREVLAVPGGRPMQLAFAPDGSLVVADLVGPHRRITQDGQVETLPTLVGLESGTPGVAVARDGRLFYGAQLGPAAAEGLAPALLSSLEAHALDELRVYDPRTGVEETLAAGLNTPVGVSLSRDESFVAVAEFYAYRIRRHWLSGPASGTTDFLIENLPGFPDGVAADGSGKLYVSLAGLRSPALDAVHPYPWLKDQLAKLIPFLVRLGASPPAAGGVVLVLDESGRVLRSLHDPEGSRVSQVTAAEPHEGSLFLSSILGDWVARCPLP